MSEAAARLDERFTWADYRTWPDDERWEIIGGLAYAMSPSPSWRHQAVCGEMHRQMANFFRGKPCRAIAAPMDVKLSDEDVVQPDILVVCDPERIKPTHIEGPPTLVVEILSPDSARHDRARKTALYAKSGVKECWIVTPWPSLAEVLVLSGNSYQLQAAYGKDDDLRSLAFPGLAIALRDVFDFPLEPGEEPRVVKESPAPYPYRKIAR